VTTADSNSAKRSSAPYEVIRRPVSDRSIRRLMRLISAAMGLVWRSGRSQLIASVLLQIVAAGAVAAQLLLARRALAEVLAGPRVSPMELLPIIGALVATTALAGFATIAQNETGLLLGELTGRRASNLALEVAATVDLDAFEHPLFYDQLQRAQLHAGTRSVSMVRSLLGIFGPGLTTVGVAVAVFAIEPLLIPMMILAAIPLWAATSRNTRDLYKLSYETTSADRERQYLMSTLTTNNMAKEVRAYDLSDYLRKRFDRLYRERIDRYRNLVRKRVVRSLLGSLIGSVALAVTIAFLLWSLGAGLSLADAGAAIMALLLLGQRLGATLRSVGSLYESALFIEDFTGFLEVGADVKRNRPKGLAPSGFEELAVNEVSYRYPKSSRLALDGVSLTIRRGEAVALVGFNGSGKTTLVKLLNALYRPDSGRITWDGVDIADSDSNVLRRSMTVVFQDFARWALPGYENIGIGRVDKIDDMEAIVRAAKEAGADEFLESLPNGYKTILTRLFAGGTDLSHGQWQRLALARALFRDAPFLILDEPTASLDAEAEARLFRTIRDILTSDRSVLLISHRFSSVRLADRIYVLHNGRVEEQGTHEELVELGARYARMFKLQTDAYLGTDVVG
jgi:ATP-binding cassette subfamily B protein